MKWEWKFSSHEHRFNSNFITPTYIQLRVKREPRKLNPCVSEETSEEEENFACYRCETKADEDVCEEKDDTCAYPKCAKVPFSLLKNLQFAVWGTSRTTFYPSLVTFSSVIVYECSD